MSSTKYFTFAIVVLSCFQLDEGYILKDDSDDTVKISLYYESRCPYSIEFISKHLYPGYLQIGDRLIVDLVPYGNAQRSQEDGVWKFVCQHGPEECHGNEIQACVLANQSLPQSQRVGFVGCIMSSNDTSSDANAQECASENGLSWDEINACVQGTLGGELLAHLGDITDALNPPLDGVPHIVFNDVYDEELEDRARYYFMSAVCSLFKVKPTGCVC